MKTNNRLPMLLSVLLLAVGVQEASAFYNPQTGRWLNRDPMGEEGGLNLYIFVAVILRVKTRHLFAGQNHPPRGGFSS